MGKNKKMKKMKTAVFVDYESWYYGLRNLHMQDVDVDGILGKIEEENEVVFRKGFGNLPEEDGTDGREREKLGKWGYDLEYTFEGNLKGNLTDFVVVDSIYRMLMRNEQQGIEKVILLSGDAHYLQTLRTVKEVGLEVEVWAVLGTISQVFNDFNVHVILPEINKKLRGYVEEQLDAANVLSIMVHPKGLAKRVLDMYPEVDFKEVLSVVNMMIHAGDIKEHYILTRSKKKLCSLELMNK